ncbi:reverse transcriptase domain-containing protein, partial [Tanacetum coccineum]
MSRKTLTPAVMAKEIKKMISQEVAKEQTTTLSHFKEYFGNIISQTIQEELNANFARRVNEVTYSDFSACGPPSYSGETIPFYVTDGFKMLRERLIQVNVSKNYGSNSQLTCSRSCKRMMMTTEEAKEALDIVTGTFFVNLLPARVLFDSGADRSFVSELFSQNFVVPIKIDNKKVSIELISMPMGEINVVIGMDWLSKYDAIISCQNKLIRIRTLSRGEMFIYSEHKKTFLAICTYAIAKKHLAHGCQAYLGHIVNSQKSTLDIDSILVVWEFPDVFPEELT